MRCPALTVPTFRSLLSSLAVIAVAGLIAPGCGVNRVLLADFDQYSGTPSNEFLVGPIPGVPNEDRIDAVLPNVTVANGAIAGKSLRVRGRIDLRMAPHEVPDRYLIEWEGLRDLQTEPSTVAFLDNDGDEALVIRFEEDEIRLLTGEDLEPPPFDLSLGTSHFLTVDIEMLGVGRIGVTFDDDGFPITHGSLEFRDLDFDELHLIRIEGSSSGTYNLDDLSVFAKDD